MSSSRIKTIGKVGESEYGVVFAVCGNAEVIFGGAEDSTGNGWNDESREAFGAAIDTIMAAGFDYEQVAEFCAYNGGPRRSLVEADIYTRAIEIDEDGDEIEGEWVRCHDAPGEVEAVAITLADKAEDAMRAVVNATIKQAEQANA